LSDQNEVMPSAIAVRANGERQMPVIQTDANGDIPAGQLIMAALQQGVNPDALEKLVALKERMEDRNARKEFAAALAKFKAECPPIYRTKHVDIPGRGGSYGFDYAPLEEALPVMEPVLESNGFTVKWDRTADKGMLTSVCTLRHVGGHSDTSSFTLPVDSAAGMSLQQKYSAASTFADRKAFFAVLGIVAEKGAPGAEREVDPKKVNDDQLDRSRGQARRPELKGKTPEKAEEWKTAFFEHFGVNGAR
jgi:hypothetical protein